MFKNKILKKFINDNKENKVLFDNYLKTRDDVLLDKIEVKFSEYYKKVIIVSYFSKSIYHISRSFDQKKNTYLKKNIFDESFIQKEIKDEKENYIQSIDDIISNSKLYDIFSKLRDEQKEILNFLFVEDLSLKEISLKYGVTPQAIHKKKIMILKKIKREYYESFY